MACDEVEYDIMFVQGTNEIGLGHLCIQTECIVVVLVIVTTAATAAEAAAIVMGNSKISFN